MSTERKSSVSPEIKDLLKKLRKFLDPDKPEDILIIKAHLLCEYYINQLLILREVCSAGKVEKMSFFEKLKGAFDQQKETEKIVYHYMNRLNKLRNKVGHELEYSLSESDVDSLGYVQGKRYILNKHDAETEKERLHRILEDIVVEIALVLISDVKKEKKNTPTLPRTNESKK